MKIALAAALMMFLMPARADSGTAIEWTQSGESLSNASPNWRSEELRLSRQIGARHVLDGILRQTSRFGRSDSQLEVSYTFPLAERLTGLVTAGDSTTHRVLPKTDLGASLQYEFAPAWLLNAGTSRVEYDNASVAKAALGIEHYFSAFRWTAGWRPTRAAGVMAHGSDLRVDYYYSDLDFVGVQAASGKEAANIDGRGVIVTPVRSVALTGRHGVGRSWTLRYGIERVKQGDFYNRTGVRLGAQYAF